MYSNRNYLVIKITIYYKPSNREALVTERCLATRTHTYLVSASDAGVCAPGGGDTAARELLRPALLRALLLRALSDLDALSLFAAALAGRCQLLVASLRCDGFLLLRIRLDLLLFHVNIPAEINAVTMLGRCSNNLTQNTKIHSFIKQE